MNDLWDRFKERKLVQWGLAYLAAALAAFGAISEWGAVWGVTDTALRMVQVALVTGFPIALVLAWYHGERGHQRVSTEEALILVGLVSVGAIGMGLVGRGEGPEAHLDPPSTVRTASDGQIRLFVAPPENQQGDPEWDFLVDQLEDQMRQSIGQNAVDASDFRVTNSSEEATHTITSRFSLSPEDVSFAMDVVESANGETLRSFPTVRASRDDLDGLLAQARDAAAVAAMRLAFQPEDTYALRYSSQPRTPAALSLQQNGVRAFQETRNSDAANWARQALDLEPDWPGAYQFLRLVLGNSGRLEEWTPLDSAYRALYPSWTHAERLFDIASWGPTLADQIEAAAERFRFTEGGRQTGYLLAYLAIQDNQLTLARTGMDGVDFDARIYRDWGPAYRLNDHVYHLAGDYSAELTAARRGKEHFLAQGNVNYMVLARDEARALIALDSVAAAREVFDWIQETPFPARNQWNMLFDLALEFRRHGYPEESERAFDELLEWMASQEGLYPSQIGQTYHYAGRYEEALPTLEEWFGNQQGGAQMPAAALLAITHERLGSTEEAARYEALLAQPSGRTDAMEGGLTTFGRIMNDVNWQWRAAVAASRGDAGETVRGLREAFQANVPYYHPLSLLVLHNRPEFEPVRDAPQFRNLMEPR